jgi:hypothetical protein
VWQILFLEALVLRYRTLAGRLYSMPGMPSLGRMQNGPIRLPPHRLESGHFAISSRALPRLASQLPPARRPGSRYNVRDSRAMPIPRMRARAVIGIARTRTYAHTRTCPRAVEGIACTGAGSVVRYQRTCGAHARAIPMRAREEKNFSRFFRERGRRRSGVGGEFYS